MENIENMQHQERKKGEGLNINAKSFIAAIAIIFALMIITYILTMILPGGEYARVIDANGNSVIDTTVGFKNVPGGLPFWKWILSPFLVLGAEGSGTIIAVIIFLLVIGGIFNALGECGLMNYMLEKIVHKFGEVKYNLMAVLVFFFMMMGSMVGSFEEVVPMAPIVVALAIELGWDSLTGVAMSLLATGCGFAAGIANPFTVGVAQGLAGLPMFSGMWLRAVSFVLIYALLLFFIRTYAKKIDDPLEEEEIAISFTYNEKMEKGLKSFAILFGIGILLVLSSSFIKALQDYTMIIVALMFLVAGIVSVHRTGMTGKVMGKSVLDGLVAISPSVIMILMASSIKYILVESKILDTMLHGAVGLAQNMPKGEVIIFIYLICLIMNFFIPSGSAKAFLLIPLIVPIAQIFDISPQLCIIAYAFGDGFSNVFYPTNPALLITLGLSDVGYGSWAKYSCKFQIANLVLTSAILLFGLAVGY